MEESDKRRQRRMSSAGAITIVTASGREVPGEAIDVSLLGCRISSTVLLEVGETITTTLRFPSGRTQAVEGMIKSISHGLPYQYGVVFGEQTVERLIKDSFKQP